jgi:GT2 family glycosyltransferase
MAFRTDVFRAVGLFDLNLGVGTKGLRAEDVDMFYRIYKKGSCIIYNPNAVILHKHLVKKEGMEKAAYENGYASKLVLFKNFDINTMALYFGGIIKLSIKFLASKGFEKRVNLQLLKGWLGLR